jgi:hypothetical protein
MISLLSLIFSIFNSYRQIKNPAENWQGWYILSYFIILYIYKIALILRFQNGISH